VQSRKVAERRLPSDTPSSAQQGMWADAGASESAGASATPTQPLIKPTVDRAIGPRQNSPLCQSTQPNGSPPRAGPASGQAHGTASRHAHRTASRHAHGTASGLAHGTASGLAHRTASGHAHGTVSRHAHGTASGHAHCNGSRHGGSSHDKPVEGQTCHGAVQTFSPHKRRKRTTPDHLCGTGLTPTESPPPSPPPSPPGDAGVESQPPRRGSWQAANQDASLRVTGAGLQCPVKAGGRRVSMAGAVKAAAVAEISGITPQKRPEPGTHTDCTLSIHHCNTTPACFPI
jgi:hypothetical protein